MRSLPGAIAAIGVVVLAAPVLAVVYREGPVPAVTGGFNEPNCQTCHFDNPLNDPGGSLQVEGMPEAFVAGREYTLSVVLRRDALRRGGFEMAARSADGAARGNQAGHFTRKDQEPRLQIVMEPGKSVEYIQHTKTGSLAPHDGEQRWSVTWTAPTAANGPVQFNIAANASNDDASPLGDFIYTKELRVNPKSD